MKLFKNNTYAIGVVFLTAFILSLLSCVPASALDEAEMLRNYYKVFQPDISGKQGGATAARTAGREGRAVYHEGTLTLMQVVRAWHELSEPARRELGRFFTETEVQGRAGQREAMQSGGSCASIIGAENLVSRESEHFIIYYTTNTSLQDRVSSSGTGNTPTYIQDVLTYAEQAWEREITDLGFAAPPLYNGKFRLYICDLVGRQGLLGLTVTDEYYTGWRARCYIELDNDYSGVNFYNGVTLAGMIEATMAHEFFHAIQFGLNWKYTSFWLLESTATWMEDEVFPDVNDYIGEYMSERFSNSDIPVDHFSYNDTLAYGSSIFWKYISEKVGGSQAMFDVWELAKNDTEECNLSSCSAPGAYEITEIPEVQQYLVSKGTTLDNVFNGYAAANYRKNYVDGSLSFFPSITPKNPPSATASFSPLDHLSTLYYNVLPTSTSQASTLNFTFSGDAGVSWGVELILLRNDGSVTRKSVTVSIGAGNTTVDGWGTTYYKAIAVINNLGTTPTYDDKRFWFTTSTTTPCTAVQTSQMLAVDWNLVTIPVLAQYSRPSSAMSINDTDIWDYDSTTGILYTGDQSGFKGLGLPGRGYWLKMNAPGFVSLAGCAVTNSTPADVPLKTGWNIFGNPYTSAVSWSDSGVKVLLQGTDREYTLSQAVARGWLGGAVYAWTGASYTVLNHNSGSSLSSWAGYWIETKKDIILRF